MALHKSIIVIIIIKFPINYVTNTFSATKKHKQRKITQLHAAYKTKDTP